MQPWLIPMIYVGAGAACEMVSLFATRFVRQRFFYSSLIRLSRLPRLNGSATLASVFVITTSTIAVWNFSLY